MCLSERRCRRKNHANYSLCAYIFPSCVRAAACKGKIEWGILLERSLMRSSVGRAHAYQRTILLIFAIYNCFQRRFVDQSLKRLSMRRKFRSFACVGSMRSQCGAFACQSHQAQNILRFLFILIKNYKKKRKIWANNGNSSNWANFKYWPCNKNKLDKK